MGLQNVITRNYMSRNDIFAELVNYYIFSGRQIIQPEDLNEENPAENVVLTKHGEKTISVEKYRDILKQCIFKQTEQAGFLLVGIENQTKLHYAMPVRSMLYDSLTYSRQIAETARKHKTENDKMSGSEFLSGLTKEDRLIPVITLVVYFGQEPWTAPRSLHEMLDKTNRELLNFITDYHINLINPHQMSENDYNNMGSHLQYVMRFIGASGSKDAMQKLLSDYKNIYCHMEKDAAELLAACTKIKITVENEEEVNMCKAWEDMGKEYMERGTAEGRSQLKAAIRDIRDGYNTTELLIARGFSEDTALDALEITQQFL